GSLVRTSSLPRRGRVAERSEAGWGVVLSASLITVCTPLLAGSFACADCERAREPRIPTRPPCGGHPPLRGGMELTAPPSLADAQQPSADFQQAQLIETNRNAAILVSR